MFKVSREIKNVTVKELEKVVQKDNAKTVYGCNKQSK